MDINQNIGDVSRFIEHEMHDYAIFIGFWLATAPTSHSSILPRTGLGGKTTESASVVGFHASGVIGVTGKVTPGDAKGNS